MAGFDDPSALKKSELEDDDKQDCGNALLADCGDPPQPVTAPAAVDLDPLIKDLSAPTFAARQAASTALALEGPRALTALDAAIGTDPETTARAKALINLRANPFMPGADKSNLSIPEWKAALDKFGAEMTWSGAMPGVENFPAAVEKLASLKPEQVKDQIAELQILKQLVDSGNFGKKLPNRDAVSASFDAQLSALTAISADGAGGAKALLAKFETVDMKGSQISDSDLLPLQKLPNLHDLRLSYALHLTDDGMKALSGMQQLTSLELRSCQLSDNGLKHLRGLTNLNDLSIGAMAGITDEGMKHLAGMTKLTSLDLDTLPITDAGFANFAKAKDMKFLDLTGTRVTDASIAQLKTYTKLKELRINYTGISAEGMEELRAALPNTEISYSEKPAGTFPLIRIGPDVIDEQTPNVWRAPERAM